MKHLKREIPEKFSSEVSEKLSLEVRTECENSVWNSIALNLSSPVCNDVRDEVFNQINRGTWLSLEIN